MNRKLILLDVVLAAVVVYGGVQLHGAYQAEKAREAALKAKRIQPVPTPPFRALPNEAPVMPSGYKDVAMKNLFHPSRDPNVPVELPPPPPPPPPMPDLPKFHGQMNLGDGPMALLVEKPGMAEKAVKPGDTIGQFKLLDVTRDEIAFTWNYNGQIAKRSLRELADNSAATAPTTDNRPAASAAAPPPVEQPKRQVGPGDANADGTKVCDLNDTYPAGAIVGNFRKVEGRTPFGKFCRWDPVK